MATQESAVEKPNIPILMLGLDGAGKTTILYKLKLGDKDDLKTIPTIGYNEETVEYEDTNYTFWDIGGLNTVRVLWKFYARNKAAVVFVVDATNSERFEEAKEFLNTIMTYEDLDDAKLIIVSNKQDKKNCVANEELEEKLDLKSFKQPTQIVNVSAFNRESLNNFMVHLKHNLVT